MMRTHCEKIKKLNDRLLMLSYTRQDRHVLLEKKNIYKFQSFICAKKIILNIYHELFQLNRLERTSYIIILYNITIELCYF